MAKEFELLFKLQAAVGANFKGSFLEAKNATKDLQKNIKDLNSTSKDIEGYKKAQAALKTSTAQYVDQKDKLDQLKKKYEETGGTSTKLAAQIAKQEEALLKAGTKLRESTENYEGYKTKLKEAGVDTANLTAETKRLAEETEKAKAAQEKMAKIGALQAENKKAIGETKRELLGTVGAITAVGTGALVAMQKASDATDRVDKLSQKIGMSRQGFQEWDFILSQSGTDIEKMQVGMKTLVQRMTEGAKGTGVGADALKTLGVSATDSTGKLKSQEKVMEEVVAKMQKMPEGAEKSKLAFDLFGKAGLELMPLLNSVGGSVEDLKKRAHELGIVLSDEAIDAGAAYQDAMDGLKRSLGGVSTQVLATLMPAITKGADAIATAAGKAQKWAAEHPELIKLIGKLAVGLAAAKVGSLGLKLGFLQLKGAGLGVKSVFQTIKNLKLAKGLGLFKAGLGGITGSILPIIAAITAVAVVIKVLMGNVDAVREKVRSVFGEGGVQVFDKFVGYIRSIGETVKNIFGNGAGPIGKFFESFQTGSPIIQSVTNIINQLAAILPPIISQVANFAQAILPALITILGTVATTIGGIITAVLPVVIDLIGQILPIIQQIAEAVLPVLAGIITDVANAIMPIVSWLLPQIGELMQALMPIIGTLASVFTTVLQGALLSVGQILGGIRQILSGLIDFIVGTFTGNWGRAWEGVKNIFGGAFNALVGLAKAPINAVISLVNKAIGGLNKIKIPDWVPGVGGKGINIPKVPQLWKGSAHAPDMYIAGEAGPELITGGRGSKVHTAPTTKNIFGRLKEAFMTGKEALGSYGPSPSLAVAGAPSLRVTGGQSRSIVINSSPQFIMNGGDPKDIESKLKQNNETLKREIKEELANEADDRERRRY